MNSSFPNFQLFVPSDSKNEVKFPFPATTTSLLILSDEKLKEHHEMLSKMISAINLDFETEVHYLYITANQSISLARYCRQADISKVLVFGLEPKSLSLHLQVPFYRHIDIAGMKILFGQQLADIATNRDKKVKLWNALKLMFPQ